MMIHFIFFVLLVSFTGCAHTKNGNGNGGPKKELREIASAFKTIENLPCEELRRTIVEIRHAIEDASR